MALVQLSASERIYSVKKMVFGWVDGMSVGFALQCSGARARIASVVLRRSSCSLLRRSSCSLLRRSSCSLLRRSSCSLLRAIRCGHNALAKPKCGPDYMISCLTSFLRKQPKTADIRRKQSWGGIACSPRSEFRSEMGAKRLDLFSRTSARCVRMRGPVFR